VAVSTAVALNKRPHTHTERDLQTTQTVETHVQHLHNQRQTVYVCLNYVQTVSLSQLSSSAMYNLVYNSRQQTNKQTNRYE